MCVCVCEEREREGYEEKCVGWFSVGIVRSEKKEKKEKKKKKKKNRWHHRTTEN